MLEMICDFQMSLKNNLTSFKLSLCQSSSLVSDKSWLLTRLKSEIRLHIERTRERRERKLLLKICMKSSSSFKMMRSHEHDISTFTISAQCSIALKRWRRRTRKCNSRIYWASRELCWWERDENDLQSFRRLSSVKRSRESRFKHCWHGIEERRIWRHELWWRVTESEARWRLKFWWYSVVDEDTHDL